jgi:two-component sensor histidine kinase/CHASE3 domain sensor protein
MDDRPAFAPGDLTYPKSAGDGAARPRSLRWHAGVPLAGAFAAMIVICTIALNLAFSSEQAREQVAHERAVDEAVNRVEDSLLTAESSQRGYLVTGRDLYLGPYNSSAASVGPALEQLSALVRGDVRRVAIVNGLHDELIQKFSEMNRTIALLASGQRDEAASVINSDVGLQLSANIIADLRSLQNDVRVQRGEAASHEREAAQRLVVALCLAAVFSVAAALLALLELAEHTRKLRRRERERDELVQNLEARVARRTQDLGEAKRRFELATKAAGVTVFVQDRDLRYLWVNQVFHSIAPDALVGKTDDELVPPHLAAVLGRKKRAVIETGEPAELEVHLAFADLDAWYDISLIANHDSNGRVTSLIGAAVDVTERKQTEAHIRLLMREIAHRAKNILTVVLAMTRQTAAGATSAPDFVARFSARLESLASSYDLLIKDDWHGATLEDLVWSQLAHHVDHDRLQISVSGPRVRVPPDATQNLGMALHELATNAAKYGALSVPGGHVDITWHVQHCAETGQECMICWQESGGPEVAPPARRGFGQVVIERSVARVLGGVVELSYKPSGVEWRLTFPLAEMEV